MSRQWSPIVSGGLDEARNEPHTYSSCKKFTDSTTTFPTPSPQFRLSEKLEWSPKGTDLSIYSPEHLLAVENELNRRPRKVLGDRTRAELFEALLSSPDQSVLRR
jgi:IS30 family transposase